MRVQLEGQTLRLRIDEAELAQLLAGGAAENRTRLPDGRTEIQQVRLGMLGWQCEGDHWHIQLPDDEVRALSVRLPSRDGLQFSLPLPDGDELQLLFDVDVRDSARKRLHKSSEGEAS
ncbi:hypothetical protein [Dyella mobilis]|uniref:DUF2917 domain-containing protein n=1 Tax=Dyella mobilis TaxID=1849582 RepID=A0ABS2KL54_9GAMM|nr:hypothetical protein [Dyella mobilis]MBM7131665.1 hypothetical protein [Dyella mobilis]GLQ96360.1 hypothetical protein GCM10007863_07780 [Dyella mobilis]